MLIVSSKVEARFYAWDLRVNSNENVTLPNSQVIVRDSRYFDFLMRSKNATLDNHEASRYTHQ